MTGLPRRGLLAQVRVATPCTERWEAMQGDARERLCGRCQKTVYDLRRPSPKLLRSRFVPLTAALLSVVLPSCGDGWEGRSEKDRGSICFHSPRYDPSPVPLEADAPLRAVVVMKECLSGSCSRNVRGHCELRVAGDQLTLSSTFEWEAPTGDVTCTRECGKLSAECSSVPLSAGSYTLHHGDEQVQLTIPGEVSGECRF